MIFIIVFIVLLFLLPSIVTFFLASSWLIGKNLFANLFLALLILGIFYVMPTDYAFLASVFCYAVYNLTKHVLQKKATTI